MLATLTLSGWAHADVGLLPVDAGGLEADAPRASLAVEDVLRGLLKERLVMVAPRELTGLPATCVVEAECRGGLMARLEVDELVAVSLDGTASRLLKNSVFQQTRPWEGGSSRVSRRGRVWDRPSNTTAGC